MDLNNPKVAIGVAALGGLLLYFYWKRNAATDGGADVLGPSLISYVSPGSRDAVVDGAASTSTPTGTSINDALLQQSTHSDDTNLSALNSDSLLTQIQNLEGKFVAALPFKSAYGFSADVTGGLTLSNAGAPSFTFHTDVAPKAPSNAAAQIDSLTARLTGANKRVTAANTRLKTVTTARNTYRDRLLGTAP